MRSVVDTNILARLVLLDDAAMLRDIESYFRIPERDRKTLVVAPTTVSEIAFLLSGRRVHYPPSEVARALHLLLSLPLRFLDRDVVERALELYETVHPDWDDCMVAAYALERADSDVLTYDRGFNRISGLSRSEPPHNP